MKRLSIIIFSLACIFAAKAEISESDYDFKVNYGSEWNPEYLYFQWVDKEAKTCRTVVDPDITFYIEEMTQEVDLAHGNGDGHFPMTKYITRNVKLTLNSNPDANEYTIYIPTPYWSDNGSFSLPQDGKINFINENGEEDVATLEEIGDFTFVKKVSVSNLTIPDTVKKIGKCAFFRYSTWNGTLDLNNVEEVGEYAFAECSIKNIKFPTGKCTLKEGAFLNLGAIESLVFDNPNLNIGDFVFFKSSLKTLEINQLGELGKSIFENSETISDVTIDNIDIPDHMFCFCSSYKNIIIGDNIKNIGEAAFFNTVPTQLKLGKSLEYIGKAAFMPFTGVVGELYIPDTVTKIDDYAFYQASSVCPIHFSRNLEWIGDYAFFWTLYNCESTVTLYSKLKHVGVNAMQFNKTATADTGNVYKDLYVYAYAETKDDCPEMLWEKNPDYTGVDGTAEGFSGFGEYNEKYEEHGEWWELTVFQIYAWVCLHVPQGCYDAYRNHPEWGKFKCIVADLIPDDTMTKDEDGSIQKHVGYVFLSLEPNVDSNDYKSYPLTEDLFGADTFVNATGQLVDEWEIYDADEDPSNNEVTLIAPAEGSDDNTWYVKPQKYGQRLLLGYNNTDSKEPNPSAQEGEDKWITKRTLVGALMVFVCPTVTLVYDQTPDAAAAQATQSYATKAKAASADPYTEATTSSSSYQHRAIYNSYPKYGVIAPQGITIEAIEKSHFDENGEYTNGYNGFIDLEDDQRVGSDTNTESNDYVVPLNAITENRVIKLTSALDEEQRDVTTSVNTVEISDKISVTTRGLELTINGADDESTVNVYDTQGVLLKSTADKTFTLPTAGVYLIMVEDKAFKALVK